MRISKAVPFFVLLATALTTQAAEPQSRDFKQKYNAESIKRVEIELPPETQLRIRTSREPVVSIDGKVKVKFRGSQSRLKRQAVLDGIEVVGEVRGARLRVFDGRDGEARSGWARRLDTDFDLTITVPEWTNIEVRQRNGRVDARGDLGSVEVAMRSGQIAVAVPKSRVKELTAMTRMGEVKADLGRITEEREGFLPGETRYENPDGSTRIQLTLTVGDISVELLE